MVKKAGSSSRSAGWAVRPRWRITRSGQIALGPGKADLLEAIDRAHAISKAAASLQMSYRRAWMLVAEMNASFPERLVETSPWRGKGASLTPLGRRALRLYRSIETRSLSASRQPIAQLLTLLRKPPVKRPRRG